MDKLIEERKKIIKSFHGFTLNDIYEERQSDMHRLDEIHEENNNKKNGKHSG